MQIQIKKEVSSGRIINLICKTFVLKNGNSIILKEAK